MHRPRMNAHQLNVEEPRPPAKTYVSYGQLVKMLLPSSGSLAIHAVDGDLVWCADGFERPDFRELIEEVRRGETGAMANQGLLRKTSAGASAIVARLGDSDGTALGFVLIELRGAPTAAAISMAISLTRPLIACLASEIALERRVAMAAAAARTSPTATPSSGASPAALPAPEAARAAESLLTAPHPLADSRLDFLLGVAAEIDLGSARAVHDLLQRCVERLDCLCAALCIPDQGITEIAERAIPPDDATRAHLDATRRHLLAWAQLNNRAMVVNRIDEAKAPYKILSAPVRSRDGKTGLLALFRPAESPNFEIDDVRLVEFLGRLAVALLNERRDALTGLLNRTGFERYLDGVRVTHEGGNRGLLVYFDIVALREINAVLGLAAGDEAIVLAAQLVRRSLAAQEVACRLAGDSFVVHLPSRDAAGAAELCAEIAQAAADLGYVTGDNRMPFALRFGVVAPGAPDTEARHWIAAAELVCRQAPTSRARPSI